MYRWIVCVVLFAVAVLIYNSSSFAQAGGDAPDFTQKDSEGNEVKLSALKGKPVLIFFYSAEGCKDCDSALKTTTGLLKQYSDKKKEIVSIGFVYGAGGAFGQDLRKKHKDAYGVAFTYYLSFPKEFGPIYNSYKNIATGSGQDQYILAVVNSKGKIALCLRGA